MPKKILLGGVGQRRRVWEQFNLSQKKIRCWLKQAPLSETQHTTALALLGVAGRAERIVWSDVAARSRASKLLASMMKQHQKAAPPDRTYYLVTFIDDCGTTSDRMPILAIDTLKKKVWRALHSMKLDAVVMLEVQPLMNYPGKGVGRSLLLHAHAIAWTDAPFDPQGAEAAFNKSSAWSCALGAKPVDIRLIKPTADDMVRVANYLAKPAISVKNLMPNHKKPGKFLMMDTSKGFREGLACRLFEGQSQIELMSVIFGVGNGRVVRQSIRTQLTQWHAARPGDVLVSKTVDVWAFWSAVRQNDTRTMYHPYRFVGGAYAPIAMVAPLRPSAKPQNSVRRLPSTFGASAEIVASSPR